MIFTCLTKSKHGYKFSFSSQETRGAYDIDYLDGEKAVYIIQPLLSIQLLNEDCRYKKLKY